MDTNDFIGQAQAARRLGVSEATLRRWRLSGRLPTVDVVGRYLFPECDVDQLAEERRLALGPTTEPD